MIAYEQQPSHSLWVQSYMLNNINELKTQLKPSWWMRCSSVWTSSCSLGDNLFFVYINHQALYDHKLLKCSTSNPEGSNITHLRVQVLGATAQMAALQHEVRGCGCPVHHGFCITRLHLNAVFGLHIKVQCKLLVFHQYFIIKILGTLPPSTCNQTHQHTFNIKYTNNTDIYNLYFPLFGSDKSELFPPKR